MKFFTKEVKIALVAIVGIVVLFFGMQFLKGLNLFSSADRYYVKFGDVSGLTASCPVYANGYKVGVVEQIQYDYDRPDQIVAVVGMDKQLRIPHDTRAEIASDLLGNVKLELRLGHLAKGVLNVGDTIGGGMQMGMMSKAADMVPQIELMLPKLDSILASVNALLQDPTLSHSLHNIEDITANLTTTTAQLHQLSQGLNRSVPGLMAKADGVLDNTQVLTNNLSSLDFGATLAGVNVTLDNVQQMTAKLNSNDGTLGLLMRDGELYRNLSSTMAHADSLMIDLKSHPKRYVHFSVFGKKDR